MLKSLISLKIDARFSVFTEIPISYYNADPLSGILQNNRSPFLGDMPGFLPWGPRKY